MLVNDTKVWKIMISDIDFIWSINLGKEAKLYFHRAFFIFKVNIIVNNLFNEKILCFPRFQSVSK